MTHLAPWGRLRELLHHPDPEHLHELEAILAACRDPQGQLSQELEDYTQRLLDAWPPNTLRAPRSWLDELLEGRAMPGCRWLRELSFDGEKITRRALRSLLSQQELERLLSLRLAGAGLTDRSLEPFLELAQLPRLQRLELSQNYLSAEGFAQLVGALPSISPRLQALDVSGNPLTARALERIETIEDLSPGLRGLSLDATLLGNHLGPLASSPLFAQLEQLSLRNNAISQAGLHHLVERLPAAVLPLRWLDLRGNASFPQELLENLQALPQLPLLEIVV